LNFENRKILVTGGTGSFGSNFIIKFLKKTKNSTLIVYSRDEYKQYMLKNQILAMSGNLESRIRFFIGDVRDFKRLKRAFRDVDYVVHAAALKHVPLMEYNPIEAIKTNIQGAENIINAALDCNVKKVIALSTDKAVNPVNLYGATKLVSDKLFIAANAYSGLEGTKFSVVRYGNVAMSRGSVIPRFRELINSGITQLPLTDKRMTRFWIDLEQCGQMVLTALLESRGGEIFVPRLPSFRLIDLIKAFGPGLEYRETGIRPGEKLHEIMITREDSRFTWDYNDYFIIYPHFEWWDWERLFKKGGKKVKKDFLYSSDKNKDFLDAASLEKKLFLL
jgi:UDP-N-acetylglucosamine 4,6-dehydratase (inverting)